MEPLEQMLRKGEIDKEVYVLRRRACPRRRAGRGPRAALRPDGAVRPLRGAERWAPRVPLPPVPDPEGVARRASPGGSLPGVRAGRHRHRRARHTGLPPRGRGRTGDGRGLRCPADAAGRHPVNNRKLARASSSAWAQPTRQPPCGPSTSSTRSARPGWPSCCSPTRGCPPRPPRSAWRSRRSAGPTRPSSMRSGHWGSSTSCLDQGLEELAAVVGAAARRDARGGRRRPQDRPRAGRLHRYGHETQLVGFEDFGSICSGGRYDALASDGRSTYPKLYRRLECRA